MSDVLSTDGVIYSTEWERYADLVEFAARALAMTPSDAKRLQHAIAEAVLIEDDAGPAAAIAFIEGRKREWLAEKGIGCA